MTAKRKKEEKEEWAWVPIGTMHGIDWVPAYKIRIQRAETKEA